MTLSLTKLKILELCSQAPGARWSQIIDHLGIDKRNVAIHLRELKSMKLLNQVGRGLYRTTEQGSKRIQEVRISQVDLRHELLDKNEKISFMEKFLGGLVDTSSQGLFCILPRSAVKNPLAMAESFSIRATGIDPSRISRDSKQEICELAWKLAQKLAESAGETPKASAFAIDVSIDSSKLRADRHNQPS